MRLEWPERDIVQAVLPLLPGFTMEVVPEIGSTNTELMRRARAGQCAPVLLVAERQTAGRGRLGRPWQSDAAEPSAAGTVADESLVANGGGSLTFSLGLPLAPLDWSGLSLAVGVSVADSLDPARRIPIMLKWPNDLWIEDCKLGGILIETALPTPVSSASLASAGQRYLVIGIGLNIGPRDAQGLSTLPAWMRQWQPEASAPELLHRLAAPLVQTVLEFSERGFSPFAAPFAARDALRGREVQLSDGMVGHCDGVSRTGELRVQTGQGLKSISSSDISVRPRAAGA